MQNEEESHGSVRKTIPNKVQWCVPRFRARATRKRFHLGGANSKHKSMATNCNHCRLQHRISRGRYPHKDATILPSLKGGATVLWWSMAPVCSSQEKLTVKRHAEDINGKLQPSCGESRVNQSESL